MKLEPPRERTIIRAGFGVCLVIVAAIAFELFSKDAPQQYTLANYTPAPSLAPAEIDAVLPVTWAPSWGATYSPEPESAPKTPWQASWSPAGGGTDGTGTTGGGTGGGGTGGGGTGGGGTGGGGTGGGGGGGDPLPTPSPEPGPSPSPLPSPSPSPSPDPSPTDPPPVP